MVDRFISEKFQWLEQITFDQHSENRGDAVRVGFAISTFVNRKIGETWPGLDHLASVLGANEKGTSHFIVIAGVMRYAAERTNQNSKFTRYPATWLNAEGWNDEYVFNLKRKYNLAIETIREVHLGQFTGSHARYVLETSVEIISHSDSEELVAA